MTDTQNVVRSKRGYHPCDYQTYLDLKQYHGLLYRAYCQHRRMVTWANKTKNRKGPEPHYYPPLTVRLRFAEYGGLNLYMHVLSQYTRARRPVDSIEDVHPLDLPVNWREQSVALRSYYAE